MNIVIFGASGRTGKELVAQALSKGHRVTAFVRDPLKLSIQHKNLYVVRGDVKNKLQVHATLSGHDAVLSALGVSKTLHHDPTVIEGIENIVSGMLINDVPRLVYESVFLVGAEKHEFSFFVNRILKNVIRKEVVDHREKELRIQKTLPEYVIVRPGRLTNDPLSSDYRHGEKIKSASLLPSISRANVAQFMLQQLESDRYLNKAVRIMN